MKIPQASWASGAHKLLETLKKQSEKSDANVQEIYAQCRTIVGNLARINKDVDKTGGKFANIITGLKKMINDNQELMGKVKTPEAEIKIHLQQRRA